MIALYMLLKPARSAIYCHIQPILPHEERFPPTMHLLPYVSLFPCFCGAFTATAMRGTVGSVEGIGTVELDADAADGGQAPEPSLKVPFPIP